MGMIAREGGRTDLEEYLAEDAVGLFAEHGREDDGDAICGCLDVDGLLVAVVDLHHWALSRPRTLEFL